MVRRALILALLSSPAPSLLAASFEEVLKRTSELQRSTNTIVADFKQVRSSALLAKPETSRGSFVFRKPSSARWNYASPRPVTMIVSGGWLTTYYPDLKKAERVAIGRHQEGAFRFMAVASSVAELSKSFNFRFVDTQKEPSYRLELKPRSPAMARRVKQITLWIDRGTYRINAFEFAERDGDVSRYEFSNIRTNVAVPQSQFALSLPPGTRIEQMRLD